MSDAPDDAHEVPDDRLWLITAGDDLYVLDDEWVAEQQYTACVGANLDTAMFRMRPERWAQVRDGFGEPEYAVTVIDTRSTAG